MLYHDKIIFTVCELPCKFDDLTFGNNYDFELYIYGIIKEKSFRELFIEVLFNNDDTLFIIYLFIFIFYFRQRLYTKIYIFRTRV